MCNTKHTKYSICMSNTNDLHGAFLFCMWVSGSLTCIFWVADCERALFDLFLKQVFLVEEEDDGGVREPLVVADAVKQLHALVHPVLRGEEKRTGDVGQPEDSGHAVTLPPPPEAEALTISSSSASTRS